MPQKSSQRRDFPPDPIPPHASQLVPERAVIEFYQNLKSKAKPVFALAARTTYTYGAFKQFEVTTDDGGDAGWPLSDLPL